MFLLSPRFYIMIKNRQKKVVLCRKLPVIQYKGAEKVAEAYRILYREGSSELVEKKSRFIADIRPVRTEEEALAFIEETRKRYWDARHHCFAYIIGDRGQTARCSDDGEPSQTAGKPMMDVLTGEKLHDVCAVVTRYFGGVLLGTGGLVRAYSRAVKEGLLNCVIVEKKPAAKLEVTVDYSGAGKIQYIAAQESINLLDSQYTEKVAFTFLVPEEKEKRFRNQITEAAGGRVKIWKVDEVYYGRADGGLIVF